MQRQPRTTMSRLATAALFLALPAAIVAFSPLATTNSMLLRGPGSQVRAMRSLRFCSGVKMMAEGDQKPIFEDDVDAGAPVRKQSKGGISDSMRARLMKESQAMGGDPDAP